jgi:hypothetical protein
MGSSRHEAGGLLGLVHALVALGDCRASWRRVTRLVAEARISPPGCFDFHAGRYTRNLVFRNAQVELVFLCWGAGAVSPIHDHGGQECWFLPVEGAFDTEDYRLDGGELMLASARAGVRSLDYRAGSEQIHRVSIAAGLARAVSLQVYARPVDFCRVFDPERRQVTTQRLHYDVSQPLSVAQQ